MTYKVLETVLGFVRLSKIYQMQCFVCHTIKNGGIICVTGCNISQCVERALVIVQAGRRRISTKWYFKPMGTQRK